MRIGSGVQSVSELFGKRQNNSKTSVNGNEAFPQTSMKVYLKTDDMLFSGSFPAYIIYRIIISQTTI